MLMSKQNQFLQKKTIFPVLILLGLLACVSPFAGAIVIEGNIKGVITSVAHEGEKPRTAFFDLAQEGQSISADFWYEFDENNFSPTSSSNTHRTYDFGFSDMGIVFHIGTETVSIPSRSNLTLFSYRNLINIFRTPDSNAFTLSTDAKYMGDFFSDDIWSTSITFNHDAMSYFTDFDLIQNLSLTAPDGSIFGSFGLANYGVDIGMTNGHVDHRDYYDIYVAGDFTDLTIGVRNSTTVDDSSSIGLLTISLLLLASHYLLIRRRHILKNKTPA